MKTRLGQSLIYKITIVREPGDAWPALKIGKVSYDISLAHVEVVVFLPSVLTAAPVFDVRPVYAAEGRRLDDGIPGGTMIGRHVYVGRANSAAARKIEELAQLALDEAKAAYRQFIDEETERSQHLAR